MANNRNEVEAEIVKTIRQSSEPSETTEVITKVSKNATDPRTAREAIRSLIDKGVLEMTLDWRLRFQDKAGLRQDVAS